MGITSRRLAALLVAALVLTNLAWLVAWFEEAVAMSHMQDQQRHLEESSDMLVALVESCPELDRQSVLSTLEASDVFYLDEGDVVSAGMVDLTFRDDRLVDVEFLR